MKIDNNNTNNYSPIYNALVEFFNAYLIERDLYKTMSLVTDDVYSIGTGIGEVAKNKKEFYDLLKKEIEALPISISYKISEFSSKKISDNYWECICKVETSIQIDKNNLLCYTTRLTSGFTQKEGVYLGSMFHMSEPSVNQEEDEFFPLRFSSDTDEHLTKDNKNELIDIICQIMPGGIVGGYCDDKFPLYVLNQQFLDMVGYTYDEFVEATDGYIINSIFEEDREFVTSEVNDRFKKSNQYEIEYRLKKKDGSYIWVYDIGKKIKTMDGRDAIISVIVDVSESTKTINFLKEENIRDQLTGIYNRRGGERLINNLLNKCLPFAYIMADIDNFKYVNDVYGHSQGDNLLKYVAALLEKSFKKVDVVFRIGGDEFGIFVDGGPDEEIIKNKMEEIIKEYTEKVNNICPYSKSSVSFGCIISDCQLQYDEIYKLTDELLYQAKSKNGGTYIIKKLDSLE